MNEKFNTREEAKAHLLGRISGLNIARIAVWGIGYDNDETAQMVRKLTSGEIDKLKEILCIDSFGGSWFSSATELLKELQDLEGDI